jgi:SAM-dependent methyltransferase
MSLQIQQKALTQRLESRLCCEGKITLPAVPHMLDDYVARCDQIFASVGRRLNDTERTHLRTILANQMKIAFSKSQRSTITVTYSADTATPLKYRVAPQHPDLSATYERWVDTRKPPYFGAHPDAKVMALAREASNPSACAVLDIGAGTGRNSLALARLGHPVDAVELTPRFAEIMKGAAASESLPIRVIREDVFRSRGLLRNDYGLIVVSEVVSDFRSVEEWRALLELAARSLADGGKFLANVFVAHDDYYEADAAREFAQQTFSFFMTPAELAGATRNLPLELLSSESVHDYEKANLPAELWPPTTWYPDWVRGLDVFSMRAEDCPVSMRWLVFQKNP